jgi:transposase-like protein
METLMNTGNLKLSKQAFKYALENISIKSIRQIARDLEIDHSYLRKKLKKEAAYSEKISGRPRKELDIERILILYKSGLGCDKIAKITGLATSTVSRRIKESVGTLRTMRQVWDMRKNGESEESIASYLARTGGAAKNKAAVERLNKELDGYVERLVVERIKESHSESELKE